MAVTNTNNPAKTVFTNSALTSIGYKTAMCKKLMYANHPINFTNPTQDTSTTSNPSLISTILTTALGTYFASAIQKFINKGKSGSASNDKNTSNVGKEALETMKKAESSDDVTTLSEAKTHGASVSDSLDTQISELKNTAANAGNEVVKANEQADQLKSSIDKDKTELKQLNSSLTQCDTDKNSAVSTLQNSKTGDSANDAQIDKQIQDTEKKYDDKKNAIQGKIDKKNQAIDKETKDLASAKTTAKSKQKEKDTATTQMNQITSQKSKIDAEVSKLDEKIKAAKDAQDASTKNDDSTKKDA